MWDSYTSRVLCSSIRSPVTFRVVFLLLLLYPDLSRLTGVRSLWESNLVHGSLRVNVSTDGSYGPSHTLNLVVPGFMHVVGST